MVPVPVPGTSEAHHECVRVRESLKILVAPVLAAAHRVRKLACHPLKNRRPQKELPQRGRLGKEYLIGEVVGDDTIVSGVLRQL